MKTKAVIENCFKETEIGLIPEDWEIVKLGDVAEISSGGSAPQGDNYFNGKNPFIRVQHIDREGDRVIKWDLITDDAVKKYKLKIYPNGTIVFPKSGASIYLEKRAMLPIDAYIVSHLCAVISNDKNVNQKFLFYELRNIEFSKDKADGYPTLNLSEVKNVKVIIPLLLEQQKIAFVLSKIQQAIEQQDRIIETTKELKKSLMNKLFTEGLHGEEQKETEIGLMPKSWDAISVQDCCEVVTGGTPGTEVREYYKEGSIRWMKSGDINTKPIYEVKNRITQLGLENSNARLMPEGTVVIALSGRGKTRGTTSVLMVDCTCSQSVAGMIPNPEKIDSFYLHYYMAYNYDKVRNITGDKDRSGLNLGLVRQIKIAKPKSTVEQKEIADTILSIDKKIWQAESKKQTFQDLFKTMLNQLMTGRIRVKDFDFEVN